MLKVYTTQELLVILQEEQRACMRGDRLSLGLPQSAPNPANHANFVTSSPFLDQFLEFSGFQKFAAYEQFRQAIHAYQRQEQISGIVWDEIKIHDRALRFPRVHEDLISLESDLLTLHAAKPAIVQFWQQVTPQMTFFLALQGGKTFEPITLPNIDRIIDRCEWATLSSHGRSAQLEILLQIGWGKPEVACYRRGFPEAGSDTIHAVFPGREPVG